MPQGLLIGIDGGGTHSTAVAVWPDGRIAAVAYGDGLNYHNVGIATVRTRLEGLVTDLCLQAGAPVDKVCAGLSALDLPADEATTRLFTGGVMAPGQLELQSDAYAALMGFTLGAPGVIVICGTGSMLLTLDAQGCQHVSGGWGYLLGDAGSSYTLAREGLIAAIDHSEGLGPFTALSEDALAFFRCSALRGVIDRVYAPDFTPDQLAAFARHVLARAAEGDAPALAIVERGMQKLAAQTGRLIEQTPEAFRVGLYGGVFAHSDLARGLFAQELARLSPESRLCPVGVPPELGAVIHLFKQRSALNESVLECMKSTYKEFLP